MGLTIKDKVRQTLLEYVMEQEKPHLHFNENGRFNKDGQNIVYMGDNPIVTFGVGKIGNIEINGQTYPNSMYLRGGFNASEERKGYGTMAVDFIFEKLPKIQNLIVQCYDSACPFWVKVGGKEVYSQDIAGGGRKLKTLVVPR